MHYEYEGEFKVFLFYAALPQTTALKISRTIIDYIENNGLDIKNCMAICSDDAAAIIREKSRVIK